VRLWITRIELTDFRNYTSFVLEPDERLTVLVGPNAVGKTNVIEAIELVTEADSFRKPAWAELVRDGSERAVVSVHAENDGGSRTDVSLVVESNRRTYQVNGGPRRRAVADVAGSIPAVLFTPDDLRMVKDSAEKRRSTIDALGSQVSKSYGSVKAEYDRIVRQRNALLKERETSAAEIAPWTDRLVEVGAALAARRMRLFARLTPHVGEVYASLSGGEGLEIDYLPSWGTGDGGSGPEAEEVAREMRAVLAERESEERARRTTLAGPHRDDIRFSVGGREARAFASQGQQRTVALAWKLAEIQVVEDITGTTPILLLDDVMSELDEGRRHALAAFVGDRAQTFVTTTNLGYFEPALIENAMVVTLS
jgi:DNA replication and repair protein RecF